MFFSVPSKSVTLALLENEPPPFFLHKKKGRLRAAFFNFATKDLLVI